MWKPGDGWRKDESPDEDDVANEEFSAGFSAALEGPEARLRRHEMEREERKRHRPAEMDDPDRLRNWGSA